MRHILEWIDLNEQAPGYKQECIVQFDNGDVQGGWLYGGLSRGGEHIFLESHAEYEVSLDVCFWMSLPPAQAEQFTTFQSPAQHYCSNSINERSASALSTN